MKNNLPGCVFYPLDDNACAGNAGLIRLSANREGLNTTGSQFGRWLWLEVLGVSLHFLGWAFFLKKFPSVLIAFHLVVRIFLGKFLKDWVISEKLVRGK